MNRPLPDHASAPDTRGVPLDRVGICGLRYPITVLDRARGRQPTVAELSLSVGLPPDVRGTHMSRFIEVLEAHRSELTIRSLPDVLARMQERLDATDAHLTARFPYFIPKEAPVSRVPSLLDIDCAFRASRRGPHLDFTLEVTVPVTTLCPCSKAVSDRGAHNQRGEVTVAVRTRDFVWIEQLVEAVESCASAPLYAQLKRADEKYVTEQAYDNPRFVEDLAREITLALRGLPGLDWARVSVVNHESIHNHGAFASLEWTAAGDAAPCHPPAPAESTDPASGSAAPFGVWLRDQRRRLRLSQREVAARLEISGSFLSRVESGEKRLSSAALSRLAPLLGVDEETLRLRAGDIPDGLLERIAADPDGFRRWATA